MSLQKYISRTAFIMPAVLALVLAVFSVTPPALAEEAGQSSATQQNMITIPPDPRNGATPAIVIEVPKNSAKSPLAFPAEGQQTGQSARPSPEHSCPHLPGTPADAIFRDLDSINLYIDIPQNLQDASACHGHEMECAGQYSNAEQYARQLVADYDAYPPALHPENLKAVFVTTLNREILPFVRRGLQCETPEVHILTKPTLFTDVYNKNSLTLTAKLTLDNDPTVTPEQGEKPTLAVLSLHLFRPDYDHLSYDHQVLLTRIVPFSLTLSDSAINERLSYIVKRADLYVGVRDERNAPTPPLIKN